MRVRERWQLWRSNIREWRRRRSSTVEVTYYPESLTLTIDGPGDKVMKLKRLKWETLSELKERAKNLPFVVNFKVR
jgi:hypothetical protein